MLQLIKRRESLFVIASPLSCSLLWITAPHNGPLRLHAFDHIPCTNWELEKGMILNPTAIKKWIKTKTQEWKLDYCSLALSVQGSMIREQTLLLSAHQEHNFASLFNQQWLWDYSYLCTLHDQELYYICGISQAVLLQYKLLSIALRMPLTVITPVRFALLRLYQFTKSDAFRPAQLAYDLEQCQGMIEQLFTPELIHRLITVPATISLNTQQRYDVLTALGLYVLHKEHHEKN